MRIFELAPGLRDRDLNSPAIHYRPIPCSGHWGVAAIIILALSLSACGSGGDSDDASDDAGTADVTLSGNSRLTQASLILPGAVCASGGIQVDTGVDDNNNGKLDRAEKDTSEVTCDGTNGTDGMTALVKTTTLAPGDSCTAGGERYEVGKDANANGILDANEIASSELQCTNGFAQQKAGDSTQGLGILVNTRSSSPAIVSAVSISNTEVLVQFSEPMQDSVENPVNYSIVTEAHETHLPVWDAIFQNPDSSTILLSTFSQSSVGYQLTVTNVRDLDGNPMEPATIFIDPSSTTFVGTDPSGGTVVDSDGDTLTDHTELIGWNVTITYGNDTTETWRVTSDPGDPNQPQDAPVNVAAQDTDSDGVTDNEEKHGGIDPRNPDTDGDTLTDNEEWNIIYSDPSHQDTDGDGTQDGFEFYAYRTSPVLADTDGDQISDTDEVLGRNRDPRIADLPLHGIVVGDVRLQIDERFTYEDVQGNTVTTDSSSSVTLTRGENSSRSTGNLGMEEAILNIETGQPRERTGFFFEVEGNYTNGEIDVTDDTSFRESQRVRDESFAKATELSTTSTVTREIVGARIDVDLGLSNEGDVAFSISNVEVTVLQRRRESTSRFVPVATLIANSSLVTGEPATFNLGPFTTEHGPILFSSRDVFPNEVDQLMQSPDALVFEIANFDITDEFGRLFTFSNQTARDRTAGIVIDYGDGELERRLVATALQPDPDGFGGPPGEFVGGFNPDGSPKGIPLEFALQDILGLTRNSSVVDGIVAGIDQKADSTATGDDVQLIPPGTTGVGVGSIVIAAGQNGVLDTIVHPDDVEEITTGYATSPTCSADSDKPRDICTIDDDCRDPLLTNTGSCTGPEMLSRLGSLSTGDFDRQWLVFTTGEIRAGAEFGSLTLKAGEDLYFAFVQDLDEDGVLARAEFLNGSTDSRADIYDNSSFGLLAGFSDGDDSYELLPPTVGADGIFDSKDTDRDGLGDFAEIRVGWKVSGDGGLLQQVFSSPRLADSDGDGLLDPQEQDLRSFCEPSDGRIDSLCAFQSEPTVLRADAIAIVAAANGVADSFANVGDEQLIAQGTTGLTYGTPVVGPGDDGIMDTFRAATDEYVSLASSTRIPPSSDPVSSDTDFDGLTDFAELTGLDVGLMIRDGGDGIADARAIGDDIQQAFLGGPVVNLGVVILPGPNGIIDSSEPVRIGPGDDFEFPSGGLSYIACGANGRIDTIGTGDDFFFDNFVLGDPCNPNEAIIGPGSNNFLDSTPNNVADDFYQPPFQVETDPLRRDTDSDLVADGREIEKGGNPRNPNDGTEFVDSDQDGLSDSEETVLGWLVSVNNVPPRLVLSNPSRPDSDFDGLPDLAERILRTDPNNADTDGDGIRDFDELAGIDFEQFYGLELLFPGFFVDGASSQQYGTDPTRTDSDGDSLSDYFELLQGYRVLIAGEATFRQVYTNPLLADTDLDGIFDQNEANRVPPTDATDPDTDDDGRSDGLEAQAFTNPLVPDVGVSVNAHRIVIDNIVDPGGSDGAEFLWFITVQKNSFGQFPLSTARDIGPSVQPPLIWTFLDGGGIDCDIIGNIPLGPNHTTTFVLNKTTSYTLEEGDSITIRGMLAEGDSASADCGDFPNYIPTTIRGGCTSSFSEVFSYDDFLNGGQANFPFPNGAGTAENCDWTLEIDVQAN